MNKYVLIFYFLSFFILFSSCGSKKAILKKDSPSLVSKNNHKKNFLIKPKLKVKTEKRYSITQDLYKTRLFLFEKLYQYKMNYQLEESRIILLEAKELKDKSIKYFLLENYKKANYYILEALDLLENQ
ncbi:MAG: hypothetical protein QMD92_03790 [bacterium]|nr:hypothetical protein [bacterium]